jgi:membrane protein DedA with SNARE-associated domain
MAMDGEAIRALLQEQGLAILFVLALIEGPIVTVIAGALAGRGVFDPLAVLAVALAGDVAGDAALYAIGRFCPGLAQRLFGRQLEMNAAGVEGLFARRGGWLLVIGKLTHVAGFAVILTAGFARMPPGAFLGFTVVAALPKVVALAGAGWVFGLSMGLGIPGLGLSGPGDLAAIDLWAALTCVALLGVAAVLGRKLWRRTCV